MTLRKAVAALVPKTELDSMKQALLGLAIDADYVVDAHCDDGEIVYAYVSDPDHPAVDLLSRHIGSVVTIGPRLSRSRADVIGRGARRKSFFPT
ncbi:hypothetical protein NKH14_28275 [Mesorhizobium sp. M1380]|uniref:hypothetical protein n=1 Tax=Mesorhizobium sp. M1380 TaxID=2957093 RepID=UPI00333C09F3